MAAVITGALAALVVPATASADFDGWASCGSNLDRDRVCFGGDRPYGVLKAPPRARDGERYKFCVTKPNGRKRCRVDFTTGKKSGNPIRANQVGRYRLRWRVNGHRVARASFRLKPENA